MNDIASKLTKIAESEKKALELNKHLENAIYGTEYGGKSEYDRFWDDYQMNGERTSYNHAFGGVGWTEEAFKPKYDIVPRSAYMMFHQNDKIRDLPALLAECGVTMDTSLSASLQYTFGASALTKIGVVSSLNTSGLLQTFDNSGSLVEIEKIILKNDGSQYFMTTFYKCAALEKVTFEGVIGGNGLDFSYSPKLTTASLLSILTALSKDSTVASGKSITLSVNHEAKILADNECNTQYNLATAAGWTIAFV